MSSRRIQQYIALLRAVNLGGNTTLRMADLRRVCDEIGWRDVRTYIQSGNVVFRSGATPDVLETALERALSEGFRRDIPVLVRSAATWTRFVKGNPFPEAAEATPNLVMLALSKAPPHAGALEALRERADGGELIAAGGGALWIRFVRGVAKTRLTPPVLGRIVGSPVTMRNWRTVVALNALAGQ